jgi:hypothetical protein
MFAIQAFPNIPGLTNVSTIYGVGAVAAVCVAYVLIAAVNRTKNIVSAAKKTNNVEALKEVLHEGNLLPRHDKVKYDDLTPEAKEKYLMRLVDHEEYKIKFRLFTIGLLSLVAVIFAVLFINSVNAQSARASAGAGPNPNTIPTPHISNTPKPVLSGNALSFRLQYDVAALPEHYKLRCQVAPDETFKSVFLVDRDLDESESKEAVVSFYKPSQTKLWIRLLVSVPQGGLINPSTPVSFNVPSQ